MNEAIHHYQSYEIRETVAERPYLYAAESNLPNGVKLASGPSRIVAAALDGLIFQGFLVALWVLGLTSGVTALGFALWLLAMMAWQATWVAAVGATPGKLLLGLRVAEQKTGQTPPSVGRAVVRTWDLAPYLLASFGLLYATLGITIGLSVLTISLLLLGTNPRRKTVADGLAGTIVITKTGDKE